MIKFKYQKSDIVIGIIFAFLGFSAFIWFINQSIKDNERFKKDKEDAKRTDLEDQIAYAKESYLIKQKVIRYYSWNYDTVRNKLTNEPIYHAIVRTNVSPVIGTSTKYNSQITQTATHTTQFRSRRSSIWNGYSRLGGKASTSTTTTVDNTSYTEDENGFVTLQLRKNYEKTIEVYLDIEPGSFITTASIRLSFDHKGVKRFSTTYSPDNSAAFIVQKKKFLQLLRKADSLFIEATVENAGTYVFPFNVSGLRKGW